MNNKISRRSFLSTIATATAATTVTTLTGCNNGKQSSGSATEPPTDKMTYRTNPKTGEKVSLLGYGMMRLPVVGGGAGRENPEADLDQDMINKQVDYAIEHGVNYFDTAPVYCQGRSETATGIALSRHPRKDFFIATKLSNFDPQTWSLQASQQIFENSLKNLQVDYIDYLLLHGCGMGGMENFNSRFMDNGLLNWLIEQRGKGRLRNLGFSYHGDVEVFDTLLQWHDEGKCHWDFVQIELNYLDWEYADEINDRNTDAKYLYAELEKRGIPAVIMEPLLGGRLSNVPANIVSKMKRRDPESSVASWAFRYAGSPEGVLTVLSGMTYTEHLKENILTYSPLRPVSEEEKEFLQEIADDIYNLNTIPCNECNYCMPCPYGIDIPGIFSHYNKCIKEGYVAQNSKSDEYRKQRRAFLIGCDRSVPKLRQADHCIGCSKCVPECPQHILIPSEMQKINEYVEKLKQNIL